MTYREAYMLLKKEFEDEWPSICLEDKGVYEALHVIDKLIINIEDECSTCTMLCNELIKTKPCDQLKMKSNKSDDNFAAEVINKVKKMKLEESNNEGNG